jgi:hypothetical protein
VAKRVLEVVVVGDAKSLERTMGKAGKSVGDFGDGADKTKGKLGGLTKYAAGAAVGAFAAIGVAMTGSVKAAVESEKSQAKLETQLKALGISYEKHAGVIDATIQKHSQLSGFDDEDLADSFTGIVRVTGDVNKALELNALARRALTLSPRRRRSRRPLADRRALSPVWGWWSRMARPRRRRWRPLRRSSLGRLRLTVTRPQARRTGSRLRWRTCRRR